MSNIFDSEQIEIYIIKCLLNSPYYTAQFIEHLDPNIFSTDSIQNVIRGLKGYYNKVKRLPKDDPASINTVIDICLKKVVKDEDKVKEATAVLDQLQLIQIDKDDILGIMSQETQTFIKRRKTIEAVVRSVKLLDETEKSNKKDVEQEIYSIIEKAHSISFDDRIGMDYFDGMEERAERMAETHEIITSGLPSLDKLMGGGFRKKSLFVFAGPGNVGKSLVLNDLAANLVFDGHNVVYLTLELAEDYISQRTDAKFAQVSMNEINVDPKAAIKKAIQKRDLMRKDGRKLGKFFYKQYAPNAASSNDFKSYLKVLQTKSGVKFDFVIIDYIGLVKANGKVYGDNLYNKIKTVCEEIRGLSIEENVCILSASQTNRESYGASKIGMEAISDSIGIVQTADVVITLARNDALNQQDRLLMNCAKSRFSRNEDTTLIKIDYDYMTLIDETKPVVEMKPKNTIQVKKDKPIQQEVDKGTDIGDGTLNNDPFSADYDI